MTGSFHERHRGTLADLSCDDIMNQLADRIGDRTGWWRVGRTWNRVWSRIVDPSTPAIQLTLESPCDTTGPHEICQIEVGPNGPDLDTVVGPIRATRFPDDPGLPTLGEILTHHPRAVVVRYRPAKRCMLRLDKRIDGPATTYLKVFPDDRGRQMHEEATQLWDATDSLAFDVAKPICFDPTTNTVVQAEVQGTTITDVLYGHDGPVLARRLGTAAASIPMSSLEPSQVLDSNAELKRLHKRAKELHDYVPHLSPRIGELERTLETLHAGFVRKPPRPIHGSPHPSQWLSDDGRLGLVDFDRLSSGDPELDVATFIGEVDFERISTVEALGQAFRSGYEDTYGPLDENRLTAYLAHKRFAKVYRTAKAVKPDGDRRAEAHLETVLEGLRW